MWQRKKQTVRPKHKAKAVVSPEKQLVRRQIIIGVALILVIATLITAVWYLTRLETFQIRNVEIVGGFTIPHQSIAELAEAELNGTYLRLVPKRFSPLYPEESIVNRVMEMSRVKNVRLEVNDENTLTVIFEEYRPQALWCATVDSPDCFFIDANGFAFAPAPALTGAAFVRYVTEEEPQVDLSMTEKTFIDEATLFIEQMESEMGLFVTHVVKFADYDVEYYVSGGGRIKISQSIPTAESYENLRTILLSPDFVHIEPGTFNYIDLRFGDKVFVNEVKEEVATSTAVMAKDTATTSTAE